MMTMNQRGFTIVELMIVVAIVGVIATIAFPMYSSYSTRSKISEALTLLGGLKNPMVEYYYNNGRWPSVAEVGGKSTGSYTSIVVSGLSDGHYVEATMKGPGELGGKQLRMAYIVSTKDWICTIQGVDDPIPDKYLPTYCSD